MSEQPYDYVDFVQITQHDEIKRLQGELAQARLVLRQVEWAVERVQNLGPGWFNAGPRVPMPTCIVCGNLRVRGHLPNCSLGKVLATT